MRKKLTWSVLCSNSHPLTGEQKFGTPPLHRENRNRWPSFQTAKKVFSFLLPSRMEKSCKCLKDKQQMRVCTSTCVVYCPLQELIRLTSPVSTVQSACCVCVFHRHTCVCALICCCVSYSGWAPCLSTCFWLHETHCQPSAWGAAASRSSLLSARFPESDSELVKFILWACFFDVVDW